MSKFKVGDKVRLSAIGRNDYVDDVINPHNSVGTYKGPFNMFNYRHLVEWENGNENQYEDGQIEVAPNNTLQVGQTYTSHNGCKWECIFIREGKAWMLGVYPDGVSRSAYDFDIDGTASWAGGPGYDGYNIKWDTKRETVSIPATYVVEGGGMRFIFNGHYEYEYKEVFKVSITFDLIDGTPDWTTSKVTPCD